MNTWKHVKQRNSKKINWGTKPSANDQWSLNVKCDDTKKTILTCSFIRGKHGDAGVTQDLSIFCNTYCQREKLAFIRLWKTCLWKIKKHAKVSAIFNGISITRKKKTNQQNHASKNACLPLFRMQSEFLT